MNKKGAILKLAPSLWRMAEANSSMTYLHEEPATKQYQSVKQSNVFRVQVQCC
jgi:hypothetical protein